MGNKINHISIINTTDMKDTARKTEGDYYEVAKEEDITKVMRTYAISTTDMKAVENVTFARRIGVFRLSELEQEKAEYQQRIDEIQAQIDAITNIKDTQNETRK